MKTEKLIPLFIILKFCMCNGERERGERGRELAGLVNSGDVKILG